MEEQNEDDLNVDMTEIKKVLEDANIFEPNMTRELMISYYRALRNSEITASEGDQTRRLNESQEELEMIPVKKKDKPFTPKTWSSEKKLNIEGALERNINENTIQDTILKEIISDLPKDASKITFGFNQMVKTFFSDKDTPETSVCRSGRQTKRKIYNYEDDDDSVDVISNKKVKNAEKDEWLKKPAQNNNTRIQKKQKSNKINSDLHKTDSEIQDTGKEKKTFMRKETGTPLSKNTSNTEMACSSIFNGPPKCRSEIMFEKLKEAEKKKESDQKNVQLFIQVLEILGDEDDDTISSEETINEELIEGLAPLDIKVSTPFPMKKGTAEQNGPSQGKEEQVSRTYLEKRPPIRSELDTADSSPSTSGTSKATIVTKNVICPICDGSFEESKIEKHAATCGDDPVSRSSSKIARITCKICDKVVDFDTSYEVHVKECISKKRDNDQ